jgi:hypothetical protein
MPAEEAGVFDHNVPPAIARRPVWEWVLAWMILPLFLLDVAVRRLASWLAFSVAVELVIVFVLLFGVGIWDTTWWGVVGTILLGELIGWSIRFRSIRPMLESLTHGVTVLAKAGERSTESLEKLKDTRERVRDELSEKEPERLRRVAAEEEAVSRDMARRRFDVGDRAGSEPARDLVESLDGAKAVPGTEDRRAPARTEDRPEAEEATTARLLRSKRKKREDQR